MFPFLKATNEVLVEKGIKLPLEGQSTTTTDNRREVGTQAQVDIFGEQRNQIDSTLDKLKYKIDRYEKAVETGSLSWDK